MTEIAIITASVMKELKSCSLYSSSYIVYSSADRRKAKYLRVNTTQKIFCNAFPDIQKLYISANIFLVIYRKLSEQLFPQKQSFPDVLQNRCFLKFRIIHRKTLVLKSLFSKVAGLKKRLQQSYFPMNTIFTEHLRWLLLFLRATLDGCYKK